MSNEDDAKEKFDNFLFIMDDQIEAVESEAEKKGISLELEMGSLENLENIFFELTEKCLEDEKQGWILIFSR